MAITNHWPNREISLSQSPCMNEFSAREAIAITLELADDSSAAVHACHLALNPFGEVVDL